MSPWMWVALNALGAGAGALVGYLIGDWIRRRRGAER